MAKRPTTSTRRTKRVKSLHVKSTSSRKAAGVKGGSPVFEVKDFSFGVANPTTIGSATGGAGAGKVSSFNELNIRKP